MRTTIVPITILTVMVGMSLIQVSMTAIRMKTDRRALYQYNDPYILTLDSDNFESMVNQPDRDHVLMVQFYLDWCEGCRKFVQVYSELARNISSWESVIKIGAINCAEERNIETCRLYGSVSYPAFKFFAPTTMVNLNESISSYTVDYQLVGRKVHRFLKVIMDYLEQLAAAGNFPPSWPDLRSIQANSKHDLTKLFNQLTNENSTLILLIDRDGSYLGFQVVMDMSSDTENLDLRRLKVSDELLEELKNAVNVTGAPILLLMAAGKSGKSSLKVIDSNDIGGETAQDIVKYLRTYFADKLRGTTMDPVYVGDMYKGLRHSLYKEVTLHKSLNTSQVKALSRYVSAIHKFFPFDNENPRRFFKRMSNWMSIRKPDKEVDVIDILAIMRAGSEGFIPFVDNYIHCKSGYPCSLWLIFHTLTVSEYVKYGKNSSSSTTPFSPQVLYAMRDYVKYFYSCAECSQHFTKMSANLDQELVHPNSSILWLWEAHNKINERLSREIPESPKAQFPSRSMCPRCYTPANHWNQPEVVNFLISQYDRNRMIKVRNNQVKMKPVSIFLVLSAVFMVNFTIN